MVALAIIIVAVASFIKNKIDENSYNKAYENLLIENTTKQNVVEVKIKEYMKVYVTGAVNFPGVVQLEVGSRIEDAINVAGGIIENADLEKVNLAYSLEDGQKLYIPTKNEEKAEYIITENGEEVVEDSKSESMPSAGKTGNLKVNLNTDNARELESLPGVGPALAQKIMDYRKENGNFKSVEDLKNVSGIGDKKFESMKEYVIVK